MANLSQKPSTHTVDAKSFFSNPYNAPFEGVKDAGTQHDTTQLAARAAAIFADKPYTQENKAVFWLCQILAGTAAAVSFATALFAFQYLLAHTVGAGLAWVGAGIICGVFEGLKFLFWRGVVKQRMRYKRAAVGGIIALVMLHIFSLAASCLGAYLIPQTTAGNPNVNAPNTAAVVIAQSEKVDGQLAEIDKQITAFLPHLTNANGKKSGSTAQQIAALRQQKDALLQQKKELSETIAAAQIADKALSEKALSENANSQQTMQILCVCIACAFELVYILCTVFVFYYLFRAFIDYSTHAAPSTAVAHAQPVAQPLQSTAGQPAAPVAQPAPSDTHHPRKIGFFGTDNSCATVAHPLRNPKKPQITAQTPYAITESNGVPVASVLGKLYTVDRVRSNYTANKSKSKSGGIYAEKATFWGRVLTELQRLGQEKNA